MKALHLAATTLMLALLPAAAGASVGIGKARAGSVETSVGSIASPTVFAVPRATLPLPYGLNAPVHAQLNAGMSFPLRHEDDHFYYFEAALSDAVRIYAWPKQRAAMMAAVDEIICLQSAQITFQRGFIILEAGKRFPVLANDGKLLTLRYRAADRDLKLRVRAEWFEITTAKPAEVP